MIMNYESIYKHISERLSIKFGETTSDGRFTIMPISCLGDCDHAPAMMINEDHYHDISVDTLDDILNKYK
jgi:NADH-quinone oxidoreductase subunit E